MMVLGVRIDNVRRAEARQKVRDFLLFDGCHTIFTPNPEMLVAAHSDAYFKDILNKGGLNLCDGKGIQLVSKEKIERLTGSDFMFDILGIAEEEKKSVFFLGSGDDEVLLKMTTHIKMFIPFLKIVGTHPGPTINVKADGTLDIAEEQLDEIELALNEAAPDILFVAFGHGKQEKFIYEQMSQFPKSVKIVMGVGGAFDMIAGKTKRAPQWMRTLGLEWVWRLGIQPSRIGRIWDATVKFLFLHITSKR